MTIEMIIKELEKYPPDAIVRVADEDDDWEYAIAGVIYESGDVRIEYRV